MIINRNLVCARRLKSNVLNVALENRFILKIYERIDIHVGYATVSTLMFCIINFLVVVNIV